MFVTPFWMAICGFIDGFEIFKYLKEPKQAYKTLYKNMWLK
jgi:hypothetical protein